MKTLAERHAELVAARQRQPYRLEIDGIKLRVNVDVFPPELGYSSVSLGRIIQQYRPRRGLDMGCGCGLLALVLKRSGAEEVWALDVHQPAVDCARANVLENTFGHVEVAQSDLFSALERDKKFDLIVFNQPYYPSVSDVVFGLGFDGGETICDRFLREAREHLEPGGVIIMPFATLAGAENDPRPLAEKLGYTARVIASQTDGTDEHRVYEFAVPRS